jgi:hypothetical protein
MEEVAEDTALVAPDMPQDWDEIVVKPQSARARSEEDEDDFVERWLSKASAEEGGEIDFDDNDF